MTSEPSGVSRRSALTAAAAGIGLATGSAAASRSTTVTVDVLGVAVPDGAVGRSLSTASPDDVAQSVADELSDVDRLDVGVRPDRDAIEVLADVDPAQVATALETAYGAAVDPDDLFEWPTEPTVDATASALEQRLAELSGGDATVERTVGGTLEATVDGAFEGSTDGDAPGSVRDAVAVHETRVVAHFPTDTDRGYAREPLVTHEDVSEHTVQRSPNTDGWHVAVTLTEAGSERFASVLLDAGFTERGVNACSGADDPGTDEYCLLTLTDDETVFSGGLAPSLAEQVESGEFEAAGEFRMTTETEQAAQRARLGLTAPLPTPVAIRSVASESSPDELPGPGLGGALGSVVLGSLIVKRLRDSEDD